MNNDSKLIKYMWMWLPLSAIGAALISLEMFLLLWCWLFVTLIVFDTKLRVRGCKNEKRDSINPR